MTVEDVTDNSSDQINNACKCAGIDVVMYSAVAAIILARNLDPAQIDLLAGFISSVGQNLSTISAAKQYCIIQNTPNK